MTERVENDEIRMEAKKLMTRLDMISPKAESMIISEKINNDPLFSLSSDDLKRKRAGSIRDKENKIKSDKKKKAGTFEQRNYGTDEIREIERKLIENRDRKLKKEKMR